MHTLLTVLDWGLGHASRSLALARQLEATGERLSWASSGPAADMLRRELAGTEVHELPGYRVRYRTNNMVWNVARQSLHWARTIAAERRETARLVDRLGVGRIVSDSRFGCYHRDVESIFLTHQLHPITNFGPANRVYEWQLRHFDRFWVPDGAGHDRLSGKLSSPAGYGEVEYLGQLSRLVPVADAEPFDLLVLLSGPEPMRTRLEDIILPQLRDLALTYRIVRGLPAHGPPAPHTDLKGSAYDYADTALLSRLLSGCRYVVARSGYSTLMDVRRFGKPAILVPTPGQTEQAYLARRAQLQGWGVPVMRQDELVLREAIARLPSPT